MDEYIILRDQEDKTTKLIETAVSVFIKNKKLLMDKRLPSKAIYPGLLMCPSGLMQEEELFEDSIKRRMKEELGITVEKSEYLFSIPDTDPISRKKFSHNFIVINKYLGEIKKSKEAEDLQWLTYDQLKEQKLVPIVEKLVDSLRRMNYF